MVYIPQYTKLDNTASPEEITKAVNQITRTLEDTAKKPIYPYDIHGKVTPVSTSTYQVNQDDGLLLVNSSAGTVNVYLRDCNENGLNVSRRIIIKKTHALNSVIINAASGQNIDNSGTITITALNDKRTIVSDGYNWWVI